MLNRDISEDIFQDTFIKVIKTLKRGFYNEEGKFLPWVMRIAHNLVIDHFRKSNRKNRKLEIIMRLSKFISTSGYASRREADVLIQKGTVIVNSSICTDFSTEVTNEDEVIVENTLLTLLSPRLWMINKPKGFLCTSKDPMGRKTIYELIPNRIPRLISVGRLDLNSEGLLLLTNNGELSRFFELPKNKVERCYLVEILGSLNSKKISLLEKGLNVGGLNYGPIKVNVRKKTKQKFTLELKLREGKNREIRNIASYFDWKVIRLKRTKYGDYTLGNLKEREIVEVKIPEHFTYSTR